MIENTLSQIINDLFNNQVAVGVVSVADANARMTRAEKVALGQVIEKRRLEFTAGRQAARVALSGLGLPPSDVLIGSHRQPLPPAGVALSISHDDQHALAVAALDQQWRGVGIDIAHTDALPDNLIHTVCQGSDLSNLATGETVAQRAKLVFCLKEALFKAIFPQVSDWMEFSQSELVIDHQNGSFSAHIYASDGVPLALRGKWFGRFAKCEKRWLAAAGMQRT